MNKALLDQICQITVQSGSGSRFNPDTETWSVLIDNVPCALDTVLMSAISKQVTPGTVELAGGGLLFIDGDYGEGNQRQFNERNQIRMNGYDFNIRAIHDVHGGWGLDHYELEVVRRVVGGSNAR